MYAWLWRCLPGPLPVRILIVAGAFALVVVVLFGWVFPTFADAWLAPGQTVGQ